jgi:hypothetical protein
MIFNNKSEGMEDAVFPFGIQLFTLLFFLLFLVGFFLNYCDYKFLILEADVLYKHFKKPFQLEQLRGTKKAQSTTSVSLARI